jgi:HK97 family phage major capsid protein
MDLIQLKEAQNFQRQSMNALMEKLDKENRAAMTADEQAVFDAHEAKFHELTSKIAEVEATLERKERALKIEQAMEQGAQAGRKTDPAPLNSFATPRTPSGWTVQPSSLIPARRGAQLKTFKQEQDAYAFGCWVLGKFCGNEAAARWYSQNYPTNVATTSNSSQLIPETLLGSIIDYREKHGVARREMRFVSMPTDTMKVPVTGNGLTVSFLDEGGLLGESTPDWTLVTLLAEKMGGITLFTSEMAEGAIIDFADWLAREFGRKMANKEDHCAFNGDGTDDYGGMLGLRHLLKTSEGLAGSVAAATDTYEELDKDDIQSLIAKLPGWAHDGNPKFYMPIQGYHLSLGRLMAGAGGNTIQDLQGGYKLSYLGYPVVPVQVFPGGAENGTAGQDFSGEVMMLFGDLEQSSIFGSRREVQVETSGHRYFEYDKIALRATGRVHIVNHGVGDETTPGSVVALCGAA